MLYKDLVLWSSNLPQYIIWSTLQTFMCVQITWELVKMQILPDILQYGQTFYSFSKFPDDAKVAGPAILFWEMKK